MPTAAVTDGRTARSQRTRTAVVDALLALLGDGNPRPTAREIAEKAGVSLRSVYVHFDDLDDLFVAAAERQLHVVLGMVVEVPSTGPLADRVSTLMRVRGRIYEKVGPVRRAAERQEPFSPTLARTMRAVRRATRDELARVFATELGPADTTSYEHRLTMLDAMTAGSTWDHLRASGMDVAQARRATTDVVVVFLERQ
ncbi:MAG: TetR/AcrR family transcriptional regulator [Actinomycetota bacterium]|nr:TetR/AcrR family transcriptional regulator [Actinomycetota bacterium]